MTSQSSRVCALAVCVLALGAAPARAQYRPRAVSSPAESYHVEFGAGYWNPTADMTITSGPAGSAIDLKNDLGLADRKVAEFHLVIKPGLKHKIRVQYIPISYTQTGTPASALTFGGQTYAAGAPIDSTLEWKAWRVGYEYDFVSNYRGFVGTIRSHERSRIRVRVLDRQTYSKR